MKTKFLALALIAAAPFAAAADAPSYKYFDISYQAGGSMDVAGGSIDTDGYALEASFPIGEAFFVAFEYTDLGTDPSGINTLDYAAKFGWHGDLLFVTAGYESFEFDACDVLFPPCVIDDAGYSVDFGLRAMIGESLELNGHAGQSDLGDFDTFTNYGVGGVYSFGESMGVSFNYDIRSGDGIDFTTYGVGLRVTFD